MLCRCVYQWNECNLNQRRNEKRKRAIDEISTFNDQLIRCFNSSFFSLSLILLIIPFRHHLITTISIVIPQLYSTRLDDSIYTNFRIHFPVSTFPVDVISESTLKSDSGKLAWRTFCNEYEKNDSIVDFNMGTLLRLDSSKDYSPENTTIVPRIQFFAIEIARNREGANDVHTK